jgi:hypothetical protein
MFQKIAPIVIITVSLIVVGVSFFGSDADAVDGYKIDPWKAQHVINNQQHDIDELINAVEQLEKDVAELKKGKR